jgi:hypothetical protein
LPQPQEDDDGDEEEDEDDEKEKSATPRKVHRSPQEKESFNSRIRAMSLSPPKTFEERLLLKSKLGTMFSTRGPKLLDDSTFVSSLVSPTAARRERNFKRSKSRSPPPEEFDLNLLSSIIVEHPDVVKSAAQRKRTSHSPIRQDAGAGLAGKTSRAATAVVAAVPLPIGAAVLTPASFDALARKRPKLPAAPVPPVAEQQHKPRPEKASSGVSEQPKPNPQPFRLFGLSRPETKAAKTTVTAEPKPVPPKDMDSKPWQQQDESSRKRHIIRFDEPAPPSTSEAGDKLKPSFASPRTKPPFRVSASIETSDAAAETEADKIIKQDKERRREERRRRQQEREQHLLQQQEQEEDESKPQGPRDLYAIMMEGAEELLSPSFSSSSASVGEWAGAVRARPPFSNKSTVGKSILSMAVLPRDLVFAPSNPNVLM